MASVFVETPGDLSQKLPLLLMNNMVQDFENLDGSWGPTGTMYFVRDFALFQSFLQCLFLFLFIIIDCILIYGNIILIGSITN